MSFYSVKTDKRYGRKNRDTINGMSDREKWNYSKEYFFLQKCSEANNKLICHTFSPTWVDFIYGCQCSDYDFILILFPRHTQLVSFIINML